MTFTSVRKITISLPDDLVDFADRQAAQLHISRSRLIAQALTRLAAIEAEQSASEGYAFFATDATEFADASARAVAEAWANGG